MPMLDVYIPKGALPIEAEKLLLLRQLTEILIEHEEPIQPTRLRGRWPRCGCIGPQRCCTLVRSPQPRTTR